MFFKQAKGASWWPARAALWLSHSSWITAASFTLFHFLSSRSSASLVCSVWSCSLFPCPCRRVLLSKRSEWDATNPAGKFCLITIFTLLLTLTNSALQEMSTRRRRQFRKGSAFIKLVWEHTLCLLSTLLIVYKFIWLTSTDGEKSTSSYIRELNLSEKPLKYVRRGSDRKCIYTIYFKN